MYIQYLIKYCKEGTYWLKWTLTFNVQCVNISQQQVYTKNNKLGSSSAYKYTYKELISVYVFYVNIKQNVSKQDAKMSQWIDQKGMEQEKQKGGISEFIGCPG